MSREDKLRSRSRMNYRDNRLLTDILSSLANDDLKDGPQTKNDNDNIQNYKTISTNMYNKTDNKTKPPDQM